MYYIIIFQCYDEGSKNKTEEALVGLRVLQLIKSKTWKKVVIESDSHIVISTLKGNHQTNGNC